MFIAATYVQLLGCVWLFATPWTAACQAPLSFTNSQSLLKFMSTELVMLSNYLILCGPLLLLPSICPSIGVFSNESALLIRWPKYWSFSISPSKELSGLTSFRIDWFDLLEVRLQGTVESRLQQAGWASKKSLDTKGSGELLLGITIQSRATVTPSSSAFGPFPRLTLCTSHPPTQS